MGLEFRLCKDGQERNVVTVECQVCGRILRGHGAVNHVDRVSNAMATLADELSRRADSKSERVRSVLKRAFFRKVEGYLVKWLENPCVEECLCKELLKEIV